MEDFERAVGAIPEVQVVQHVLGLFDYRLRVVARDIADFERVLRRRIMTLPGVGQIEANVLLTEERRPGPLGIIFVLVTFLINFFNFLSLIFIHHDPLTTF